MMIICLIPEILSTIDIIFCHFGPFFAISPPNNFENQNLEKNKRHAWRYHHFTLVYHKWWSYDIWFLRYWVQQTDFLTFWTIFCPFTNLTTQKIKILEKKKKTACGDIIILHMCTINDTYMIYGFWDMECKRQCFVILGHFLPFHPTNNPKNQNFEKMEKQMHGHIIFLHLSTTREHHMMYGSWDTECDGQNFLSYWTIFSPFSPLTTQKI